MAFSNTFVEKEMISNGLILERGTWTSASATGGTTTCDTTVQPEIVRIDQVTITNDSSGALYVDKASRNTFTIVCTSGDTGTYTLIGKAR